MPLHFLRLGAPCMLPLLASCSTCLQVACTSFVAVYGNQMCTDGLHMHLQCI